MTITISKTTTMTINILNIIYLFIFFTLMSSRQMHLFTQQFPIHVFKRGPGTTKYMALALLFVINVISISRSIYMQMRSFQ